MDSNQEGPLVFARSASPRLIKEICGLLGVMELLFWVDAFKRAGAEAIRCIHHRQSISGLFQD